MQAETMPMAIGTAAKMQRCIDGGLTRGLR